MTKWAADKHRAAISCKHCGGLPFGSTLVGELCTCAKPTRRPIKTVRVSDLDLTDKRLYRIVQKAILGSLKSTITVHGPITPEHISSAEKRITGQIMRVLRDEGDAR